MPVLKLRRVCKDEKDARSVLDELWRESVRAEEILVETLGRNHCVFEFEKELITRAET